MGAVHIVENEDGSTNQIYRISVLIAGEENLHMRHVQEQIMGLVWSLQDEHLRIEDGDMLQIATPNIGSYKIVCKIFTDDNGHEQQNNVPMILKVF